jgi:hypothetical protein
MNASTEFLFDAALRGAGVLALALMLGVLLRSVAAARRYALWTAAMVLLAVLPIAMQMLPGWHVLPQEHEKPLWELPQAEMPLEATAQPVEVETVALPETEPVADLKPVSSPEPVLAAKPAFSWSPQAWFCGFSSARGGCAGSKRRCRKARAPNLTASRDSWV